MSQSPLPRIPVCLPKCLHQQVNMYALAASATAAIMYGLAYPAEAKIIYTPSHVRISANSTIPS
jgi:hypothetical protein